MNNKQKKYYYKNFDEDLVKNSQQDYKLPDNYVWINNNKLCKIFSSIMYWILWIFGYLYCKLLLRVSVKNKKILKKYKNKGYFLFGNHTQVFGDIFMPAIVCSPKRVYYVVNTANLGIPGIGKFLPVLGAIPIPSKISQMKSFYTTVTKRTEEKRCVVIYPEAHVWPYYCKIRKFQENIFKFPINMDVASFCITTTYQKRKIGNKPKITLYIDGPFFADNSLSKDEKARSLHNHIYECMKERSKESSYEYIKYIKR